MRYQRIAAASVIALLVATAGDSQTRTYTNADLNQPLPAVRVAPDAHTLAGLIARQYVAPTPITAAENVRVRSVPGAGPYGPLSWPHPASSWYAVGVPIGAPWGLFDGSRRSRRAQDGRR